MLASECKRRAKHLRHLIRVMSKWEDALVVKAEGLPSSLFDKAEKDRLIDLASTLRIEIEWMEGEVKDLEQL